MVKKLNHSIIYLLVLIIVLSSLSSCSSIYGDNHDVSGKTTMEIDPSEEYFTSGSAVSKQENGGKFYNDTLQDLQQDSSDKIIIHSSDVNKLSFSVSPDELSVIYYDESSKGAQAYLDLAREVDEAPLEDKEES